MKGAKKLGFSFNVRTPTSVIINAVRKALKLITMILSEKSILGKF